MFFGGKMRKIIVDKKDRTVIYDSEKRTYEKYIRPKFREKLQIIFGIKRSHGKNADFLSKFLKDNGVKTYEVISYTKYSYITKEIEGKTLLDSILENKDNTELIKEYLNKYIEILKKIINLNLYYRDFAFNNLIIDKNNEVYIIDIDEMEFTLYSKFLKNKKVLPKLKRTLEAEFMILKHNKIEIDFDVNYIFNKIITK